MTGKFLLLFLTDSPGQKSIVSINKKALPPKKCFFVDGLLEE
jgi:hypothetical protein